MNIKTFAPISKLAIVTGAAAALFLLPGCSASFEGVPAALPNAATQSAAPTVAADSPAKTTNKASQPKASQPKSTTAPKQTSAPARSNLQIDITANQIGRTTLGVSARIHGMTPKWTGGYQNAGPGSATVMLNGEMAGPLFSGSELGSIECKAGTAVDAYDTTWSGGFEGKGMHVEVPGPGTYTITVQAPYCGSDGNLVPNEVSKKVTVKDPKMSITDEAMADIDGDGKVDRIKLMMPKNKRAQGQSSYQVALVTRASGQTTEVPLYGDMVATFTGTEDLNSDGVPEVQILSSGEDHTWWTVLTFTGGEVVAVNPVAPGDGPSPELITGVTEDGGYQKVFVRDGRLQTWHTNKAWDRESTAKATLQTWEISGTTIASIDEGPITVCVTADQKAWDDPNPC